MRSNDGVGKGSSLWRNLFSRPDAPAKHGPKHDAGGPTDGHGPSSLSHKDRDHTGPLRPKPSELGMDEAEGAKRPTVSADGLEHSTEPGADKPLSEDGLWAALQGLVDGSGRLAKTGVDGVGDVMGTSVATQGAAVAAVLDFLGAEETAADLEAATTTLGEGVNAYVDEMGEGLVDTGTAWAQSALKFAQLVDEKGWDGALTALADGVWGPPVPEQQGQFEGLLGEITSRLNRGESTHVQLGGSLGLSAVLGAEGSLDGTMSITHGQDGAYYVSYAIQGELEGSVGADTGASVEVAGLEAGATAELGAAIQGGGTAKLTMRFDPAKPEDRARMAALMEPAGLSVRTLLNPLAMAAPTPEAFRAAMAKNLYSQEVGLKLGASLKAEAGAEAPGAGVGLGAGVAGDGSKVVSRFADGSKESTYIWQRQATASVEGNLAGQPDFKREGGQGEAGAFTLSESGRGGITGMKLQSTLAPAGFEAKGGVKQERFSLGLQGRDGDWEGTMSFRTREVSTYVTQLTPTGLQKAKVLMAQGRSAQEAFRLVAAQPGMASITQESQVLRAASLGVDGKAKLVGAGGRFRLEAGLGSSMQSAGSSAKPGLVQDELNRLVERAS